MVLEAGSVEEVSSRWELYLCFGCVVHTRSGCKLLKSSCDGRWEYENEGSGYFEGK